MWAKMPNVSQKWDKNTLLFYLYTYVRKRSMCDVWNLCMGKNSYFDPKNRSWKLSTLPSRHSVYVARASQTFSPFIFQFDWIQKNGIYLFLVFWQRPKLEFLGIAIDSIQVHSAPFVRGGSLSKCRKLMAARWHVASERTIPRVKGDKRLGEH